MNCEIYAYKDQTMKEHVESMLKAWEMAKRKYVSSIKRTIKSENINMNDLEVDKFMKSLIILHDTGKGAKIYQHNIEKGGFHGFRHEMLSAFYTKKILEQIFDRKTAFIGSLVVMIHHEPILMGQIEKIHKEELSPEVIVDKLKEFNGVIPSLKDFIVSSFKDKLNFEVKVPEVNLGALLQTVMELSVKARGLPNVDRLRLVVGCILLPLVLCDYKGAERRGGEMPEFSKVLELEWVGLG
ncbi:MAG: CRISPR-associated endonuclease Cas3'' [Archaeoglobaceae archaeon]|nr:CRISPR-associated endonuclease Cas3'' [Archaeoglobaceae archaeon]